MRSSTAVLAALAGTALAAGLPPHERRNSAPLVRRDCDCNCRSRCRDDCKAFGTSGGNQFGWGMCVLTCADSCGCDPNVPCRGISEEDVCKLVKDILGPIGAVAGSVSALCP